MGVWFNLFLVDRDERNTDRHTAVWRVLPNPKALLVKKKMELFLFFFLKLYTFFFLISLIIIIIIIIM